ncbi:hypothetical protein Q9189_006149 [Teloschistes chrysophthalmus]
MAKSTSRHKAMGKHKKYAARRNKAVDQSQICDVIDDTGHLIVAFDGQDFEFDFDGDFNHWIAVTQEVRNQRLKEILSKIYSWKIDIIRALLDKNLIAKGLTMDFEFAFDGSDPVNDRWTDLIVENDRWFEDYIVTRSGRQIKTHASAKAKNIFPGPNVKFEPTYRRLFGRDEIEIFKAHGFRGRFT